MKAMNPATEELIAEYPELSDAELAGRLEQAEAGFRHWSRRPVAERAERMAQMASLLREEAAILARLMTSEMGKLITASEAEVHKCARVCDYYAEHAARFLATRPVETEATRSYVRYDPLGAILAIMPWNFPFWQVFRFAAPALSAGNVGLLKHAGNVPGSARAIEHLFARAGFPEGVMTALLISHDKTSQVIGHPAICGVTLTGSDRAGRAVAAEAAQHIKKTVLELGGSDPFVVLADADPQQAARQACTARTIASGQSCIAAKRFLVEEPIAEAFEQALTEQMQALKVGDPLDRGTQLGPLAREDLLETLHQQVQRTVQAGAELRTGGKRLERRGYFYAPTVLCGVEPGMAAFDEETFGPVAAVTRAHNRQHAVELANRSPYGLGASIWTAHPDRAEPLVAQLQAGSVFINEIVKSDPRLPFGGVKRSGYGRELAEEGIHEFVNVKSVWVQ